MSIVSLIFSAMLRKLVHFFNAPWKWLLFGCIILSGLSWHLASERKQWRVAAYAWQNAQVKLGESYIASQQAATLTHAANLAYITSQQEKENAFRKASYDRRVADVRRMWAEATSRKRVARSTEVSSTELATGGTSGAADDVSSSEYALAVTLMAIQLDELITWVINSSEVETVLPPKSKD